MHTKKPQLHLEGWNYIKLELRIRSLKWSPLYLLSSTWNFQMVHSTGLGEWFYLELHSLHCKDFTSINLWVVQGMGSTHTSQGCLPSPQLFSLVLKVLASTMWQNKTIRSVRTRREEVKSSLIADNMIVWLENTRKSVLKLNDNKNQYGNEI